MRPLRSTVYGVHGVRASFDSGLDIETEQITAALILCLANLIADLDQQSGVALAECIAAHASCERISRKAVQ